MVPGSDLLETYANWRDFFVILALSTKIVIVDYDHYIYRTLITICNATY